MTSTNWIEDDDAKSFLKQVKGLRDDVSIAKEELSVRLQDAATENPQLFVKLVDEMISTYENKNNHRELPLAERMAESSDKYKKLPAKLRRRRNSSKISKQKARNPSSDTASLGILSKYESHDTISYTISDDEASHTSKSVLSIDADADAVEIEFALDENASQSSNVSYASRVAKMIRKLKKRFSDKESVSSELTQDFDEFDILNNYKPKMVDTVQTHETGLQSTMSDPSDTKMAPAKQIRNRKKSRSRPNDTKARVRGMSRDDRNEIGSKSFPPLQSEKASSPNGRTSMFRRIFRTNKKKTNDTKRERPDNNTNLTRVPVLVTPTDVSSSPSRQSQGEQQAHLQESVLKSHLQQSSNVHPLPDNRKLTPNAMGMNSQVSPGISKIISSQHTARMDSAVSLLVANSSIAANKTSLRDRFGITESAYSQQTQSSIPDIMRSFDDEEENSEKTIPAATDESFRQTATNSKNETQTRRNSKDRIQWKGKPDPPTIDERPRNDSLVLGEKKNNENQNEVLSAVEAPEHGNRKIREEHLDHFGLQIYSPKRSYSPKDLNLLVSRTKDGAATCERQDLERPVIKKTVPVREPADEKKNSLRKADPPQSHVYKAPTKTKHHVKERKTGVGTKDMRNRSKKKKAVTIQSPKRRSRRSGFDDDKSMSSLSFLTNFLDDLDDSLNDAIDRNEAIKTLFDSYDKLIENRKKAKKKMRDEYKREKDRSRRGSPHQTISDEFSIGSVASFDMLDPF